MSSPVHLCDGAVFFKEPLPNSGDRQMLARYQICAPGYHRKLLEKWAVAEGGGGLMLIMHATSPELRIIQNSFCLVSHSVSRVFPELGPLQLYF